MRATRNAGVCSPESDDQQTSDDVVVYLVLLMAMYTAVCGLVGYLVLLMAMYTAVCGLVGYLWGTHGAAIEAFLWALASKLF